jgi:hypothetical protein
MGTLAVASSQTFLYGDRLTLTNGDSISGSIIKKDADILTFKSPVFGEITIPWKAVASLTADDPVTVEMPGGELVAGKIVTSEGVLEVMAPAGTTKLPLAEVAALRNAEMQREYERRLHPNWFSLWAGNVDLAYALARGNARTDTFTAAMAASRVTRNDRTSAYYSQIYATGRFDGLVRQTAEAIRAGWSYDRNLTPRVFANFINDYEYDAFQDLDLRFIAGGGLGFIVYKTDTARFDLLGGADYQREKFATGLTRSSAEIFGGNDWVLKVAGPTSLTQAFRFFANATRTGEYRIRFDLTATTAIRKWIGWNVTIGDRMLSDPLPGRQRNDLIVTTGLRFIFER